MTPRVDKSEVLRYLGHRGQAYDQRLADKLDEAVETCLSLARPAFVYRRFPLEREPDGLRVAGTELLLTGRSIARHLKEAGECALLAATLGVAVESEIRRLERTDLTASLLLDAAATDCVEKACDDADEAIRAEAEALGLHPIPRFSPGYGDLPLALQPGLLRVLDAARRIGLTCTDRFILLPRKSVTAVTGLSARPQPRVCGPGCASCNLRDTCDFRRCAKSQPTE